MVYFNLGKVARKEFLCLNVSRHIQIYSILEGPVGALATLEHRVRPPVLGKMRGELLVVIALRAAALRAKTLYELHV